MVSLFTRLRNSTFFAVLCLIILFFTYASIFFVRDVDHEVAYFLHGVKWFLYYACLLYIPFGCIASGIVYIFISYDRFPYNKILYCSVNMILTFILAIISFKNYFMVNSYIILVILSIEMWVIAFIDECYKYDILYKSGDSTFLISKQAIKPYNNLFDYNTSKTLLQGDLSYIKQYHNTPELIYSVNNGMQSLLHRLSNGDYLLTDADIKQIKKTLLTTYGGTNDDKFFNYEREIYDLIKALYLLDHIVTR